LPRWARSAIVDRLLLRKGRPEISIIVTEEEIQQIYRLVLGRDADYAAYKFWLPKVREYQITARQFVIIALTSEEYRVRNPDVRTQHMGEPQSLVEQAEKLIAGINSTADAQRELGFSQAEWFHSFLLADGTQIHGAKGLADLQLEFEEVFGPIDLAGRSVLDIGAWNGAFTLEAMRRGAARVLAVDFHTWVDPRLRGLEKFLYVRKDSGFNDIDYKLLDVQDISKVTVGIFDIVLFLGVFYHLREPLSILDRLSDIVQEWLILETYLDPIDNVDYPAMRYYPGAELVGDSTNWWGPNQPCIEALLRGSGFVTIEARLHPMRQGRGIFHARK
jgi:tRNA (mo5U34)-methyltransferase